VTTRLARLAVLAALALVATTGCAISTDQLKTVSAGRTGCAPDQVAISNRAQTGGFFGTGETWNATCNGQVYLCSALAGLREPSCAPAAK
jgi:hypothetical protein